MNIKKYARGYIYVDNTESCRLTEKQFRTLMNIKTQEKEILKNLSKNMKVSTSSLCIMLNKMTDEGLVHRETDIKDRRNTFYSLTRKGRELLDNEVEIRLSLLNKQIDKLSDEKKQKLYMCMTGIEEIIEELK